MSKINSAVLALLLAAASAGFALCMSLIHYPTWQFIPSTAFAQFQQASAVRTVPVALGLGIPSLVLSAITAFRGLPGVPRSLLWMAVILAAIPWIATPTVMIPIQERLAVNGPISELVQELVWKDILLRSVPAFIQSLILFAAVVLSVRRAETSSQEGGQAVN